MDKLKLAHEYLRDIIKASGGNIDVVEMPEAAWGLADAMQAEADKRKPSGLPEALKEKWQPDWSQAPDDAKYWAMDKDGSANFFKNKPEITNGNGWDFGGVMQSNNGHSYHGNWQDSLRERPHGF